MKLRALLCCAFACSGALAAVAACGDEATIDPVDAGNGAETSTETDGSSTTNNDTGSSSSDAGIDGEAITDGGGNIDPDAGEDDAGLDAAICNAVTNDAPAVDSECISVAPIFPGGALVAGKYYLTAVKLHAPPNFCQNAFQKASFKQTMELTVDGNGVGTANVIAQVANGPGRTRTTTLDPPANNGSPLVATPTCPPRNGGNVVYFSGLRNAKQTLIIRGAYGQNAVADYQYEKQ
jgi:hypothetical protein